MTPSNSFGAETPSIITNETLSAYEESVQEKGLQKTSHLERQIITAEETLQVEQRKLAKFAADQKIEQANVAILRQIRNLFASFKTEIENSLSEKLDSLGTQMDSLATKVDDLATKVDGLATKVDGLTARVEELDESRDYNSLKKQIVTLDEKLSSELLQIRESLFCVQESCKEVRYCTTVSRNNQLFDHNCDILIVDFREGTKPEILPDVRNMSDLHNLTLDEVRVYLKGYKIPFTETEEKGSLFMKLRDAIGMTSY